MLTIKVTFATGYLQGRHIDEDTKDKVPKILNKIVIRSKLEFSILVSLLVYPC